MNVLQHCTLSQWMCVGYFSSSFDRSMCGFISSNSTVLCNIWWDYLQRLSSLEALEVSSCRLRNTLIKLIAFILLIQLLNCVIWNKKRILEDFSGIIAHFSGSSMYGTHPTVKHMIGSKTALSTERQRGTGRFEPGLLKIPRHHLLYFLSQQFSFESFILLNSEFNSAWTPKFLLNGPN